MVWVACACCNDQMVNRSDHNDCPVMFNLGSGVKYVCGKCYDGFDFGAVLAEHFRKKMEERHKAKGLIRSPYERAKGARYGKR